jgi:hypothetical protein
MTATDSRRRTRLVLTFALLGGFSEALVRVPVSRLVVGRQKSPLFQSIPEDSTLKVSKELDTVNEKDVAVGANPFLADPSTQFLSSTSSSSDVAKEIVLDAMEDPATISTLENVDAILSVSQYALEEAEASLPKEVVDSIPLIPPTKAQANNTLGISAPLDIVEASTVIGTKIEPPSVGRILRFAIPAIAVWLCGPLLSLIDTSAVGLLSGTSGKQPLPLCRNVC